MKCYECKWLDRSVILTSNPPQYRCTLGFGSHYADHECEYDFMPIVRCKDCKNWRESHSEDEESYCYIDGRTTDSTDYCSWGELAEQTDNKLPGYDEIMEKLDKLTLRGDDND